MLMVIAQEDKCYGDGDLRGTYEEPGIGDKWWLAAIESRGIFFVVN